MGFQESAVLATPPHIAELERLGDEIAELSAHLDAATARALNLMWGCVGGGRWGCAAVCGRSRRAHRPPPRDSGAAAYLYPGFRRAGRVEYGVPLLRDVARLAS